MTRKYTAQELLNNFKGKYIKVYPHHFDKWNAKLNKHETTYEVQSRSNTIKEDHKTPEEIINSNL